MLVVLHQGGGHGHSHGGGLTHSTKHVKKTNEKCSPREGDVEVKRKGGVLRHNINVTAASIHVIGDFLQTLGVLITSYIVWFRVSKWSWIRVLGSGWVVQG